MKGLASASLSSFVKLTLLLMLEPGPAKVTLGAALQALPKNAREGDEDKGYSFVHCSVTGTGSGTFLGRAWRAAPKVTFAYTEMGEVVKPEGWTDNNHPEYDKSVSFGEYKNTGPGSSMSKRVSFTKELSDADAKPFISLGFIDGSKWLLPPPTPKVRDYRADWNLSVNQPVAGNYYPVIFLTLLNLGIFTSDNKSEFSVLVDRATGGSSIQDGQVEMMLHRRLLVDDGRGVGEALDETVCISNNTCQGLTVRGNYYMSINQFGDGAQWRRTTGQEVYSPLLLAFTHEV
ncbi:hypothetical protein ACLB2K_031553 [Fragaria x ananassa]